MMNGSRKSDRPVVATKPANKVDPALNAAESMAEWVERRGLAEGNLPRQNTNRAQDRTIVQSALGRIRQAAVEDKLVQRATVEVLNAIYETDFLGFSYGYRPGRSQHQALDALYVGLGKKVDWVLDGDIS